MNRRHFAGAIAAAAPLSWLRHALAQDTDAARLAALNVRLEGTLIRHTPSSSIAILASDGNPGAPYRVGAEFASHWRVHRIDPDEVILSARGGSLTRLLMRQGHALSADDPALRLPSVRVDALPNPMMIQAAEDEFNLPAND